MTIIGYIASCAAAVIGAGAIAITAIGERRTTRTLARTAATMAQLNEPSQVAPDHNPCLVCRTYRLK